MSTATVPRPANRPLSSVRKFVFGWIVAGLLAALGFGVTELTLRIVGYGHNPCFYRETRDAAGQRWIRENRWVTAPYFPPELIRRPQVFRLPEPKPPDTYRIFVLGSSAAMGDPEPAFSMSRMLALMLRTAFPRLHFEVVNAGITAINSHVVRPIARDCRDLQPDLYIVYEGNNEVIGPYGPGTVFTPFLGSSIAIHLGQTIKDTRTGQLAAAIARRFGSTSSALDDWGGMRMFLHHEISAADPRLDTVRALFRANLLDIARSGTTAGATVLLCTVLTNEKDFAPFRSRHRAGLTPAETTRWGDRFAAGERAVAAGDDATAEAQFRAALAIDDQYAELAFQLGRLCLRQNRLAEAKTYLQRALDLDTLRFRTDSHLNAAIRSLAGRAPPGTEIVDLAAAAARLSPQGVLGDEFLYEHVHLNFQGTYVVARELFPRVAADLARRHLVPGGPVPEPLSMAAARHRLGYTLYEQAIIARELQARFAGAPFTGQSDNRDRQRLWAERAAALAEVLARPGTRDGLVALYEQALAQSPDDWLLERNIGMAYVNLHLPKRARPDLVRAAAVVPDDPDTLFALATADQELGDRADASRFFASVRWLEPTYPGLPPIER